MGLSEIHRSLSRAAFLRSLQRLVPEVQAEHLVSSPAGVRAQVVRPDGTLEEDFAFEDGPQALHVLNAPSPAATSCLAIGRVITERVV
jgi:L-2-hydroxyglutarate oxidase